MAKLTSVMVSKLIKPGRYGDGNGLYLLVGPKGNKSWVFRYKVGDRERGMGLGPYPTVSLALAREKTAACRRDRADGRDPIEEKLKAQQLEEMRMRSRTLFRECADRYVESHEPTWKNAKHRQQWRNTLATFAHPHIGNQAIADVDVTSVLKVLEPIWVRLPETASRLRGRLEVILDWAKVKGLRLGENPARWKGNLDQVLPKKGKIRKTRHHSAVDYGSVPAFFANIRGIETPTSLALQFLILTAARTGEVIGAQWDEVNLNIGVWTIAAERMKAGREHRVPLSNAAINVLDAAKRLELPGSFIFPGRKPRSQLSNMAMLTQVRRSIRATTHGFRSSFRDWAAETTSTPSEVVEMALAHAIENRVEAAYRRGDLLEKRRALMEAWATYCLTPKLTLVGTAEK